jgi:chromosome segregation ATPase
LVLGRARGSFEESSVEGKSMAFDELAAQDAALELAELRAQLAERDEALEAARQAHARAIARLREALAAAEPGLDAALLTGETLEEVEASYAAARETVARIREAVRREAAAVIPPGATLRQQHQAALSALEKIRAGLGRR